MWTIVKIPLKAKQPKTLIGCNQKVSGRMVLLLLTWVIRRQCTSGVQIEPKSLVKVFMWNVAMSYLPPAGRKLPARDAEGGASMRGWKKRMLLCNVADRIQDLSTRKWADVHLVSRCEKGQWTRSKEERHMMALRLVHLLCIYVVLAFIYYRRICTE